jgi:hypothetical protein
MDWGVSEKSIGWPPVRSLMPKTEEIKCLDPDCELDMFENHYTYDIPDDLSIDDLQCPYCGETDSLELIEL